MAIEHVGVAAYLEHNDPTTFKPYALLFDQIKIVNLHSIAPGGIWWQNVADVEFLLDRNYIFHIDGPLVTLREAAKFLDPGEVKNHGLTLDNLVRGKAHPVVPG